MRKETLLETKEKIIKMAVEDVNNGKYSVEILQIVLCGINDILQEEYKIEQEKNKVEKEKQNKEYAEMIAKVLYK